MVDIDGAFGREYSTEFSFCRSLYNRDEDIGDELTEETKSDSE